AKTRLRYLGMDTSRRKIDEEMGSQHRQPYEAEIDRRYFLRQLTKPLQKLRWYQRAPAPVHINSVPVLHPGSQMMAAFPSALAIALGTDSQDQPHLWARLD